MKKVGAAARATIIGLPVLVLACCRFLPAGASASEAVTFDATATAEGIRATLQASGAPATSTPIDGGGPVAQASLDSLGTSTAFASHIYPGEVAVAGPGLVAGFSNGQVNLPPYPFIATSDAATHPESDVSGGGATLRAESRKDQSNAKATVGLFNSPGVKALTSVAYASARFGPTGPEVVSESIVDGFNAGPLVLGQVRSMADARLAGDGSMRRQSEIRVVGGSIAGNAIGIGPGGITLGPSNSPFPETPPNDELRQAGITLRYLAPIETEDSIVSAGLLISVQQVVPGPVSPVTVNYVIGRASAYLGNVRTSLDLPTAGPAAHEESPPSPPPRELGAGGAEPLLTEAAEVPGTGPAREGPEPESRTATGATESVADAVASPSAVPEPDQPQVPAAGVAAVRTGLFRSDGFYAAVAAGGLLAAGLLGMIAKAGRAVS